LTQVISHIDTVFNVVIPCVLIISSSLASLVYLLRTAHRSYQAAATPHEVELDSERKYIRSTAIAQLCASVTFVVFGLPAHVHQLIVLLAGGHSGPVGVGTYMTQRLLLVVLYSRCSSTFFVNAAGNHYFRRRLSGMLGDALRRGFGCSACRRSTAAATTTVDIALSPAALTWSCDNERPPTNGDSRDRIAVMVTTSLNE